MKSLTGGELLWQLGKKGANLAATGTRFSYVLGGFQAYGSNFPAITGGVWELGIIETPQGNVFSLSHNPWVKCYTAVGPLEGGRCMIQLGAAIRVRTTLDNYEDAISDLTDQLVGLGY